MTQVFSLPPHGVVHAWPLEIKHLNDKGFLSGYASVFGVSDSQRDVVMPGAFVDSIRQKQVHFLWQHKPDEPIGKITQLREDQHGLYLEAQLALDITKGREAYELLTKGIIDGLSIGYTVIEHEMDAARRVRLLKKLDLWEVSLVTFPANQQARVMQVKNSSQLPVVSCQREVEPLPSTIREFEQFLRHHGFSKRRAVQIALKGFTPETTPDEQRLWRVACETGDAFKLQDAVARAMQSLY
jgi:HK97 family phage prohead protease